MNGVVTGGWGYIWAAYIISGLVLAGFTARAIAMFRSAVRRAR